jgi:glutaminase
MGLPDSFRDELVGEATLSNPSIAPQSNEHIQALMLLNGAEANSSSIALAVGLMGKS